MIVTRRLLPPASLLVVSLLVPVLLTGCRVDTHKNGDDKNVSIATPFGSLNVKTDEANAIARTGLTAYPGASPVHKQGDDHGAADVNMSFGSFRLGVHAVELQTSDPEDKVLGFYRKDMGRYGGVITCHGHQPVGQPTRTAEGLSCESDEHDSDDGEVQLRAGSQVHQHIVGVHAEDGGTHIGLVALDLPSDAKNHDSGDRE